MLMSAEFGFKRLPSSLHDLLDRRASERAADAFATIDETSVTYGELAERSKGLARKLAAKGVGNRDRVLVLIPASGLQLCLWFAVSRLGAVEVPINPAYKGMLLRQLVETSKPRLCIIAPEFAEEFRNASEGLVAPSLIIEPCALVGAAEEADLPEIETDPRDISCIIFTSGTTGRSKGVMMSHSHQLSFGQAFAEIVGLTPEDTAYNFLPFFHVAAKFVALGTMLAGGRMLLRPGFSLSSFWSDVRAHGVTVCAAVGGLCHMINSQPERSDDAENPLKVIYAVPVPWEFKERFEKRFGVGFIEGYGGTENNLVAYSRPGDPTPRSAIGRASPHFDLSILDAEGRAVPTGEPGEICIRPRHPGTMMSGYFGMPDKTLETMTDFWFHTGDRGYLDDNGYLFFLDRLKDTIRRRGENISSFEVERVLNRNDGVAESAVVPVPSELGEDEVKAVVVRKPGTDLTEEMLFRYAMENMPYFMVPRFIEFRDELPRTPTMKIRKMDLRADGNGPSTWDCEKAGLRISRHGPGQPRATVAPTG
jgi:crotonobetaine/carnitine-CoA ligase